ncbi:MAG: hypothetical protein R2867_21630 [Caldilineaceae bacterium]
MKQFPQPADAAPRNSIGVAIAQYFHFKTFRDGWIRTGHLRLEWVYERRLQEATNLYNGHEAEISSPIGRSGPIRTNADEMAMTRQNITDYINQNALAFVTGTRDLNADWDTYIAGLDQLQPRRLSPDDTQEAYDASGIQWRGHYAGKITVSCTPRVGYEAGK